MLSRNLKHYIKEIKKGNSFFGEKHMHRVASWSFIIFLACMAVLFLMSFALIQAAICALIPIVYFSINRSLLQKEKYLTSYTVTHITILFLVLSLIILSGWDCSFDSYLFASITSSFYFTYINDTENKNRKKAFLPLMLSSFSLIVFFICWALCRLFANDYPLGFAPVSKPEWITIFYILNTILSFGIIVIFSYLFVWELESRQRVLADKNEQLDELAHKDTLTKLLNRRSMDQMIALRMNELKTTGRRFTMILGDIDDFKKVNDTYGHDAGDLVLAAVAKTISDTVRSNDSVCRWGGEEILILVDDPLDAASLAAERIRKNVEALKVPFEGKEISVTMTFGISESIPGFKIEHLIQQADDKLYYGKKHGKNQVVARLPQES